MKNSNQPNETVFNAAAHAEQVRSEPMNNVDHLTMDENGKPLIPPESEFREEKRAVNIGRGAAHTTYSEDVAGEVAPHAATHAAENAGLEAAEPRREIAEQKHEHAGQNWRDAASVPHNVLDKRRKVIANVAKIGFVIGDTAVLADALYRASTPIELAILVGLSLATSVIMIGAHAGHEVAAANHRQMRGAFPAGLSVGVRTLFDTGDGETLYRHWVTVGYLAAAGMFMAIFFLSDGAGDPAKLALGYALLGSVTVAGSACAEAYATNDAAEQVKATDSVMSETGQALVPFEKTEKEAAAAGTNARHADLAARHRAVAATATVGSVINRLVDTPEIGGYIDGGHIPVTPETPQPVEIPKQAADVLATSPRSRQRSRYSIVRQAAMPADASGQVTGDDVDPADANLAETTDFRAPPSDAQEVNGKGDRVGAP